MLVLSSTISVLVFMAVATGAVIVASGGLLEDENAPQLLLGATIICDTFVPLLMQFMVTQIDAAVCGTKLETDCTTQVGVARLPWLPLTINGIFRVWVALVTA